MNDRRESRSNTPWRWLAERAKYVIRYRRVDHGKPFDDGMIYADTRDFEEEFELPLRIVIAETELAMIVKFAKHQIENPEKQAIEKQTQIDQLRLEMDKRANERR